MSRGTIFVDKVRLVTEECCNCGVVWAFPEEMQDKCLRDHSRRFYCPNGHSQFYTGKTEEQKLRERLEREQERARELETQKNRISSNYSRMRKRVASGVCPCCNRTFQNLMAHMRTEHPDFGGEKQVKTLRLLFGLTQYDLAKEVGVNAVYISAFENGKYVSERAKERIENWLASVGN